ncbi:MAG: hypothetical protein ACJA0P_004086 [Planctomycetota bacterium]|jgi:hypothetical protein
MVPIHPERTESQLARIFTRHADDGVSTADESRSGEVFVLKIMGLGHHFGVPKRAPRLSDQEKAGLALGRRPGFLDSPSSQEEGPFHGLSGLKNDLGALENTDGFGLHAPLGRIQKEDEDKEAKTDGQEAEKPESVHDRTSWREE